MEEGSAVEGEKVEGSAVVTPPRSVVQQRKRGKGLVT